MSDTGKYKKLKHELDVLQAELEDIKRSKGYKFGRAASVIKTKFKKEPIAFPARLAKTLVSDPRRVVRLLKGREVNVSVKHAIENRAAIYEKWIRANEPDEETLSQQKDASQKFAYQPTISIITPVFNPPVDVLEELIKSVTSQTYPHFELCLGNFGDSVGVKNLLDKYADQDSRIKVYEFAENKGIAGNSNSILEKVSGEFIGLLDHDDTLSPDALYENIALLNQGEYDFIFSDKDMMDDTGVRYEPLFKPVLSPETMLSANYLTHFDIMRTETVKKVGGWDSNTDGAQDWDLFLKIMAETDKITHIPKILYHWRVIATSTAHSIETKPYALAGQRNAVQKYLDVKGIHATPYHYRTELILRWGEQAVDSAPVIIVRYHTLSDTLKLLGRLRKVMPRTSNIIVLHADELNEKNQRSLKRQGANRLVNYPENKLGASVDTLIGSLRAASPDQEKTVVFVDDRVHIPSTFSYNDLVGWLSIGGVGAVGTKLLDRHQVVIDLGSVLTTDGLVPIFRDCPSYHQSYLGNTEWVRNIKVVSQPFFAANLQALTKTGFDNTLGDNSVIADLMIRMSTDYRMVVQPKSIAYIDFDPFGEIDQHSLKPLITDVLAGEPNPGTDRYSNPNLLPANPMQLNIEASDSDQEVIADQYQHDALILSRTFDLRSEEIDRNANQKPVSLKNPKTVGWFLPSFDGIYAGLNNIFSFANYLANDKKLETYFFILTGSKDAEAERKLIVEKFPALSNAHFVAFDGVDVKKLPKLDIGIATLWATAYPLVRATNIARKCYFIQDNEVNFYPKGSISALVEQTYKLGFLALANTPGLLDLYQNKYGGKGVVVKSLVDLSTYQPAEKKNVLPKPPYKVFFYGRPNMPRNAFEIGLAGLSKLKEHLGDKVHIVAAGADWDPATYGVQGVIDNLGKIPYADLPDFYRSLDAGLMFMFSGHPGVIASELMASGVPVVVNEYDDITWNDLYVHEKTCLKTLPTASVIADNFERLLTDQSLRKTVIDGGLQTASTYYTGYDESLETAFKAIKEGTA